MPCGLVMLSRADGGATYGASRTMNDDVAANGGLEDKADMSDTAKTLPGPWKRGLPPGPYYPGMEHDFEVRYAPLAIWHRRIRQ